MSATPGSPRYSDRDQAGRELARRLDGVVVPPLVVIGIPRGGLLVAWPIAERFRSPLTVSFARKLSLPIAPELAVGALDEDGHVSVDHQTLHELRGSLRDLSAARERAAVQIRRQQELYRAPSLVERLADSTAVLVDDGLATGATLRAALARLRRRGARWVVVAVPCASAPAAEAVAREADRFVCPIVDPAFFAVGAYYDAFDQVSDGQVSAILERARPFAGEPPPPGPRPSAR